MMLNGKLLNVLLVDDDETTNFLNTRTLKKAGIVNHIHIAENGKEALDYLTTKVTSNNQQAYPKPDIIFLDINMPVMNGWDFLAAYNQLEEEKKANVIVVMLTTSLQKEDYNKAQSSKIIKGLINKPLNKKTLLGIIEEHFDKLTLSR